MENKKIFCLDANVLIKYFVHERHTRQTIDLITAIFDHGYRIVNPSFCKIEFYSILRKKIHFYMLVKEDADKLGIFLADLELLQIGWSNDSLVLQRAMELAIETQQPTIYDTLYLATAISNNAIFVTEDKSFLKKIKSIYPSSYSVEEALKMAIVWQ